MKKVIQGFIVFNIVLLVSMAIIFKQYRSFVKHPINTSAIIIQIEEGDTFGKLGEKIKNIDPFWLKIYLRQNPPDFKLKKGSYKIPAKSDIKQVLESLKKPIIEQVKITLLEGRNIYDIDEYLSQTGLIDEGSYIEYVNSTDKIQALSEFFPFIEGIESLEGFLYPDTYLVKADFQINEFVIQQLNNFEKRVFGTLLDNYSNETIYDVITLASIVEKEERNPKNKATVAGILKKRLNKGRMIGADITVCYPYKLTSEECKLVVTKYLYEKNDYNTRTMVGLPKTPIGNPSFETVEATINDKETDYYYYLHDIQTGQIYYGRTNAEHERNKALYLR